MKKILSCAFNMYRRPELDYLICNDSPTYADLAPSGDPEAYIKAVTGYGSLDKDCTIPEDAKKLRD